MEGNRKKPKGQKKEDSSIFPTFFMAGFECSTFVWKDGKRKDYVAITGHDQHLEDDYDRVMDLGIGVVREAIRWPMVDKGGGRYDWTSVDRVIEAMDQCHITPIWDLCHYGFPDGFDVFSQAGHQRFIDYCRAVAGYVCAKTKPPRFFTPINEITFFSAAATDMGWMYPFAKGRCAEFKRTLCAMAIEGAKAIRETDPEARMVHVDPIIHAVAPRDRPDLKDDAWKHAYDEAYEGWDMLYGMMHPELGGVARDPRYRRSKYLQLQPGTDECGSESREVLGPRDPRRKPLGELLKFAWDRYHRPIIIGETSGHQEHRAEWLRMTMEESMKALNSGIDLQGVCLYPCVDIPDWQTDEWAKIGIFDIEDRETCERIPCDSYIQELRVWQKRLDQAEHIESDSFGNKWGRVQLEEVRRHAREWEEQTPGVQRVGAGN